MTIEEATDKAFERYAGILASKGADAVNSSNYPRWYELSKSDQLNHAMWMCNEILKPENKHYSIDKKSRWLGFVQCILIMHGLTSIESERNITRPWFTNQNQ